MPPPEHLPLPHSWQLPEISADVRAACDEFRTRRLTEPLAAYAALYPAYLDAADFVVDALPALLTSPADSRLVAGLLGHEERAASLRSLAAVPISHDDLKTLLENSLSQRGLRSNQALAETFVSLLRANLDPIRFSWVTQNRAPTTAELSTAKQATAVIATISAVQTSRRKTERDALEGKVAEVLVASGYQEASQPQGGIQNSRQFPAPGYFFRSCLLGGHNSDFAIGLFDGRLLALECKASNSEINSRKRLNKEVVVDAGEWYEQFGRASVLVAAALRGVFKAEYVRIAQNNRVFIFWWHNLAALTAFLEWVAPDGRTVRTSAPDTE